MFGHAVLAKLFTQQRQGVTARLRGAIMTALHVTITVTLTAMITLAKQGRRGGMRGRMRHVGRSLVLAKHAVEVLGGCNGCTDRAPQLP
jgi:hypothetical protein